MRSLRSPLSGRSLHADSEHSLADGAGERWPMIDGIAYLRAGSYELATAALERLDRGDYAGALALLLAENDPWWDAPPPSEEILRRLALEAQQLNLREVMERLGWGRVGDYFAHRWTDPTFVAGLALTDAHWSAPHTVFELACGIGHHLLALQRQGCSVTGGDIVFAKLWVARHFVVGPEVQLVCFDAELPWPVTDLADLVICHDAFYFLTDKSAVAQRMRERAGERGILLSHVHNRSWPNLSGGDAMSGDELNLLFPNAVFYDDAELTEAGAQGRHPISRSWEDLEQAEAFSIAWGSCANVPVRAADGPVSRPQDGAILVRNPLLDNEGIAWPSERYRAEYSPRATYGIAENVPPRTRMSPACAALAASRELVELPERW